MISQPRYSKDEFARRGDAIYDRAIGRRLEPAHDGEFVAIDIESGDFEVDPDELAAADRLRARHPEAQVWLRKVGSRYLRHFGPRRQHVA